MTLDLSVGNVGNTQMPVYQLVKTFDYFSSDVEGQIHLDDREKRYLKMPGCGQKLKLKGGLAGGTVPQLSVERGVDYILDWTVEKLGHCPGLYESLKELYGGADFVTHYNSLRQAGKIPYKDPQNPNDALNCDTVATKYKDIIFLNSIETVPAVVKKWDAADFQEISAYGGRKFVRLMTSRSPNKQHPCSKEPIPQLDGLYMASRYDLGENAIFLGNKVDCVDYATGERVALRTNPQLWHDPHRKRNFKDHKCRPLWLNLHLTGTPRVVLGMKDKYFIVHETMEFKDSEIPTYVAEGAEEPPWTPAVCMTAVDRFLGFVKEQLGGAEDLTYKRFVFGPEQGQVTAKDADDPKYHFISQKFLSATMDIL